MKHFVILTVAVKPMDTQSKLFRELGKKNEEICRLQQELSFHLHQNETFRKKLEEDEKAELKVNKILLNNLSVAKREVLSLKQEVEERNKQACMVYVTILINF